MSSHSFAELSLSKEMLENLNKISYTSMTPVQEETLPLVLAGKDVMVQAKTGSGKTAAFGIGVLHKLQVKKFRVQALVLCPTRELADQVAREMRLLAKFTHNIKVLTLCGGTAFGPQLGSLRHGAHIIVGTPGRVLKHLNKESLNLDDLETLVFDEADRMLDMGFIEEIDKVLEYVPTKRQTLFFSATYTDEITAISQRVQNNATFIETISTQEPNEIEEVFHQSEDKKNDLIKLFHTYKPKNAIVFTNTKLQAQELAENLVESRIDALAIHGDLEQYERNDVLVQFENGSLPVLIATDVAARGLDIKELAMVVNYDLPHTMETYTHRIGRTARAGAKGVAVTLFSEDEEEKAREYDGESRSFEHSRDLKEEAGFEMKPLNTTVVIEGGKKDKLRAGDILGAFTGEVGLDGKDIGKISIYERQAYVAIKSEALNKVQRKLLGAKIKNKKLPIWIL